MCSQDSSLWKTASLTHQFPTFQPGIFHLETGILHYWDENVLLRIGFKQLSLYAWRRRAVDERRLGAAERSGCVGKPLGALAGAGSAGQAGASKAVCSLKVLAFLKTSAGVRDPAGRRRVLDAD